MRRLILAVVAVVATLSILTLAPVVGAEDVFTAACTGDTASSAVCQTGQNSSSENPLVGPNGLITRVTQLVVFIVGIAAIIMIIISGMRYITSAGDSAGVNNAKNGILYAVIGLVVAVVGQVIVSFVLNKL